MFAIISLLSRLNIIGNARNGVMDQKAKNRLFDYFAAENRKLTGYVKKRISDIGDMDAEDIVGDVMLNLFKRADASLSIENLGAYVYRALRNKIIDHHRNSCRTVSLQNCLDENGEFKFIELLMDETASVSGAAERKEFMRRLSEAVSALEPKQQAVFIATEMHGISFKALSAQWNEPVGTLLSRKFRAVKTLQKMLKDYKP